MTNSILYVGVDVDDKNFHGAGMNIQTGEIYEFKTKPTFGDLKNQLKKLEQKGYELKVCYEATYIGFNLCRQLNKEKINCKIIAPSLIPEIPGSRVKTDKKDCLKLAEYYAKDMLTPIYIPDEKDEEVRSLLRARSFLVEKRKEVKNYITSMCRYHNINYKEDTEGKNYWTKTHKNWLITKVKTLSEEIKIVFETLIIQYEQLDENINKLDLKINQISEEPCYKNKKNALNCFRGLDTLSSMILIVELGDIKRFIHPEKLTSYAGLSITEYSSGGKEKKSGITKAGNKRIRTTVVEACQNIRNASNLSRRLKEKRKLVDNPKIIDIAERCYNRLKKKSSKMFYAGKPNNKIKVACARELLNFVWEMLTYVS